MRRMSLTLLSIVALMGTMIVPIGASAAGPPQIDLKVLLLSSGNDTATQLAAWTTSLDALGVPYDVFVRSDTNPVTTDTLEWAPDHGRYNAIVLTDGTMTGNFGGPATAAEKQALAAYENDFGVREIDDNVQSDDSLGLDCSCSSGSAQTLGVSATLTPAGQSVFSDLNPAITVPYETGVYMFLSTPYYDLPQWNGFGVTDVASIQSLVQGPTVSGIFGSPPAPAAIVGIATHLDGRETMFTTTNSAAFTRSDKLLHAGMLQWVTRGVYLGSWHNYLSLHFDDVLLGDARWSTTDKCTPTEDPGCPAAPGPDIRMTAGDVTRAVSWSSDNGMRLDLVFNGSGATEGIPKGQKDPLTKALLAASRDFGWINHTWSHANLDAPAKQKTIVTEIKRNQNWARTHRLPMNPAELVTGGYSGLTNPAMPAALAATGVTRIAGDASTNAAVHALGSALVLPRRPTDLYYNAGTRAEQLDEFNWIYRNDPFVNAPVTWERYVSITSDQMLGYVIANDARSFFSHQNNLAEDGTFYDVGDALLATYHSWFSVPLVQPTMTEGATVLSEQSAWKTAMAAGDVTAYVQGGEVHIDSTVPVSVPVSGTTFGSAYGGLNSGWVAVTPGTPVIIPVA